MQQDKTQIIIKPSKRWLKIAKIYKFFAEPWKHICDFSDEAAIEMYIFESKGVGDISVGKRRMNDLYNGFAVGKHWLDVTVTMWREDVQAGILWANELFDDERLPHWFLVKSGFRDTRKAWEEWEKNHEET